MTQSDMSRRALLLTGGAALGGGTGIAQATTRARPRWTMPKPQPFRRIDNGWVPMRDGVRLAMRLWLPDSATKAPVGVVLEYIPYRTSDMSRARDDEWGAALASHGFAFVRIDVRGTGNSFGVMQDEYEAVQQDDLIDAIAWLAKQPWSNGSIGMRGYSWGGIAALQAAVRKPPALKAIVAACASTDRYREDAHWIGGQLALPNFQWGTMFKGVMAASPDPAIMGPEWRDAWMKRLEATPAIATRWTRHQSADDYWKVGSVSDHLTDIECAVYTVSGQADGYVNVVLKLLETLHCPRKGMIGAWSHSFPDAASPGPKVDWLREEVRWWTHWLTGRETGIMDEPMLRTYVEDATPVQVTPRDVPGAWVAEAQWPSPGVAFKPYHLDAGTLSPTEGKAGRYPVPNAHVVGLDWREWIPIDMGEDLPRDQREDDRNSLIFDSEPLVDDWTIVGQPRLLVRVRSEQPVASLVARICAVDPDGASWPVSYAILNLAHRDGSDRPAPLEPSVDYDVTLTGKYIARRIRRGARIRVALSETLWPMVAPPPRPANLTIDTGHSRLLLPIRAASMAGAPSPATLPPVAKGKGAGVQERVERGGRVQIERHTPYTGAPVAGTDIIQSYGSHVLLDYDEANPSESHWSIEMTNGLSRGDWDSKSVAATRIGFHADSFTVHETITVYDHDRVIFETSSETTIPRHLC